MAKRTVGGNAAGTGDDPGKPIGVPDNANGNASHDPGDVIPVVEPGSVAEDIDTGTSAEQPAKRGRGRPRGSRNATSTPNPAKQKQTAADLTGILLSLHLMGAAILKVQELEIDEAEAKRLAESVARINELYGGIMLSEKTAAWIQFSMALGAVYGPRAIAYKLRMAHEAKHNPPVVDGGQPISVN